MKKILIGLDYTPSDQKVAETGYALAKAMKAEVCIIHVITDPAYYAMEFSPIMGYQGGYTAGTIAVAEDIKKEAEDFLAATVKHLGDNSIQTKVLEGETTDEILAYSKEWNADLIVIGSHRHKGLERLLVTDVAVYLLKHSKIPLFTIPTEDK
jgi:nucleotide-binding universal stress UspA family protein